MAVGRKSKKKTALQLARETTKAAVEAFSALSADLADASATIEAQANSNRELADSLLEEAVSLDSEAMASARLAGKLAEFVG